MEDYFQIKIPKIFAHNSGDSSLAFPILSFKELGEKSAYKAWRMWAKGEVDVEGEPFKPR